MSIRWRELFSFVSLSCAAVASAGEPYDYFGESDWESGAVAFAGEVEPPPSPAPVASTVFAASTPCYEVAPPSHASLCERATLLGDWCGARPTLAESGIVFQTDVTQFYYGVASGGLDREFRYAGHGDYVANIDGGKLVGAEGLFVKIRAEHRFGEPLAGASGAFLPSDVLAELPSPNSENLYLTNFLFTQALSENFALYAGKLDTFDGDQNAFASGRGKTQFSNVGFVVNPALLRTVPYSTLGAGFVILDEGAPIFNFGVLSPTEATKGSGFDSLYEEGVVLTAELRRSSSVFGFAGHQLIGGTWSSRDFVALDQDPRIVLPNVPINRQSGSWALYSNFDQYLVHYDDEGKTGWGVFGRAAIADEQANPIAYFLSAGIGGNSPLCGRQADTFGAGYYYAGTSSEVGPVLEAALGPVGDGQAVELFYNAQVTPWLHVTPDFQVVMPARESVDTALVAGVRANVAF